MHPDQIKDILEAAIFISTEPVSLDKLATLFNEIEGPNKQELRLLLQKLAEEYSTRSIQLQEVAEGYRFQVNGDIAKRLATWLDDQPIRFSRAFLETLSLIAYKQPITRGEIEEIRGVSVSSHIMRTLQEGDWIKAIGQRDVPGKPILYGTTPKFLSALNLRSLSELPPLSAMPEEEGAMQLALDLPQ